MPTSAGLLDPPLGNTRLQVVKLFCSLLQCCDHRVNRRVAELNTFSILMVGTVHVPGSSVGRALA